MTHSSTLSYPYLGGWTGSKTARLVCWVMGHRWMRKLVRVGSGWRLYARCARCGELGWSLE